MIINSAFTEFAPSALVTGGGRVSVSSSPFGAGSPVLGSGLRGTGLFTESGVPGGFDRRPTEVPVAQRAWIFGYAPVAGGAAHRTCAANAAAAAAKEQNSKMRAFRGLEPWRDPT